MAGFLCEAQLVQDAAIIMEKDKLVTRHLTLWFQDGILYGRYADGLDVSLEVAKEVVESRINYSEGKSCPLLLDMKGIKSATPEAREYLATIGATLVKAGALIVDSKLDRTMGNIYLFIDKPLVPTRLFTNEERAVEWLRNFVD